MSPPTARSICNRKSLSCESTMCTSNAAGRDAGLGKRRRCTLAQRRRYPDPPIHALTLIRPLLPS
jgi:hypothetical protein